MIKTPDSDSVSERLVESIKHMELLFQVIRDKSPDDYDPSAEAICQSICAVAAVLGNIHKQLEVISIRLAGGPVN